MTQVYLDKPALLSGFKFDFRVYVLVLELDPLTVYVFREGLARLCTQKYTPPSKENLKSSYMHLTNYSLNKHNEESFVRGEEEKDKDDDSQRSKRKISTALRQLREQVPFETQPGLPGLLGLL